MSNPIETEVVEAFQLGDFQRRKRLLDENPQFDANKLKIGTFGRTPLQCTCRNGNLEMTKYLILEKGIFLLNWVNMVILHECLLPSTVV
jgi:hypothetical protein